MAKKPTTGHDKLIGSATDDNISAMAGNDTVTGLGGNDTLNGEMGNDILDGGTANDVLNGGEGNDKLIGGSGNDKLDGGKGNDVIIGDAGKDTLNGGAGVDSMTGGDGDDYYYVDHVKDSVVETNKSATTGGKDTVEATSSYTLLANVENLILKDSQGKGNSGTGNDSDNVITGSIGDNVLSGKAGNDTLNAGDGADILDGGLGMDVLTGGDGSDLYIMNNIEDKIIETAANGDEDQIEASVTFDLNQADNVEWLTLIGAKALSGTGNELNNLLQEKAGGVVDNTFSGHDGDDTINGEGGNDTLEGGAGNDELDGGDGEDTATFNGIQDDYQITVNPDAEGVPQIIVEFANTENPDNEDGTDEGTDILSNIENLEFADGTYLNVIEIFENEGLDYLDYVPDYTPEEVIDQPIDQPIDNIIEEQPIDITDQPIDITGQPSSSVPTDSLLG